MSSTSDEVRPKWIQRPASPTLVGEHVDERGDVVVGDLLALLHGLDRERRAADRLELARSRAIHRLAGGDLDRRQASILAWSVQMAPISGRV